MTAPVTYIRKAFRSGNVVSQCILYVIGSHADNDTGECFMSLDTIAAEAQCTRRAVQMHIKRLSEDEMLLFRRTERGYEFKIFGYEEHQNSVPKRSTEPYSTDHGEAANANDVRKSDNGATNKVRRSAHGAANDVRPNSVVSEDNIYIYNNPPIVPPSENWEQAPKRVSNENQTSSGASGEDPREIARRAKRESESRSISNKDWPRFNRFTHPEVFDAWMGWFEVHGYSAQIYVSNLRSEVWVPDADPEKGAELFKQKNPLANPAQMSNSSLSANGST